MTVSVHTCFDPLLADDVTDRSLGSVVESEWRDAAVNGLEAAVLVLAILLWQGTPLWIVAASTVGAVILGTLLHQTVLVLAVLGLRVWRGGEQSPSA